jgi:hypothetical protein
MAGKYEHSRLLLLGGSLIARNFLSLNVYFGVEQGRKSG